jgi:chemotaxis protein CheD
VRNLLDKRLPNVFLKPGEVYVSQAPALVSTVLGSCVSVILYSPDARMGAMCHAMLPCGTDEDPFRYVDSAVGYLYGRLRAISGRAGGFEAKLFGGADMLDQPGRANGYVSIGRQNIDAALKTIEALGLRLIASDTGGDRGRKVFFYSGTGEVFVRPVRKSVK